VPQVISYKMSRDGKWALLVGISAGPGGVVEGKIHLYSVEKSRYQFLKGHAGCFATIKVAGRADPAQVLIFEGKEPDQPAKLFVMEVGRDKDAPGGLFRLAPQLIQFPPEAANDFPVSMTSAPGQDIIFMITRMGFLFLFDIHTGKTIYRTPNRIAKDTIFVSTTHDATSGVLGVTARSGKVLQININEQAIVPYIVQNLRDNQLAIEVAKRLNLPGARDLYVAEFNKLLATGDAQAAARLAAESPQGILRTQETIERFKQVPPVPGQPQPIFQYFSILLETGTLNKSESIQLVELAQGRTQLIEKWLTEEKLEASEELGDLLYPVDVNLALSVYVRANVPEKAINCFLQRGEFDKIVAYAQKVGYRADYTFLLQNLVRAHPQGAVEFAKKLVTNETGPLIDTQTVVDIFLSLNRVQETTAFLLEALKANKREEGHLQTKLLEIILASGNPQFAEAILQNEMFSYYDRPHIAKLCEQAGLYQRALEHYTNLPDIKRLLARAPALNPEFLLKFFGQLDKPTTLECLNDMMATNMRQNLQLVVQVATKYSDQLGSEPLIKLFEKFKSYDGLFYYLAAIVNTSQVRPAHIFSSQGSD
jgi:clathrin heavy chain